MLKKMLVVVALLLTLPLSLATETLPSGTDIGGSLSSTYEPSGAVWNTHTETLFIVGDGGQVTELTAGGSIVNNWNVSGSPDLEGITFAAHDVDSVYLGVENPRRILRFSLSDGTIKDTFDLTEMNNCGAANTGLEALTFGKEKFYAGCQGDGRIYEYVISDGDVDQVDGVEFVQSWAPSNRTDIAGLEYDAINDAIWVLYDGSDLLISYDISTHNEIEVWTVDADDPEQEGVAFTPDLCNLYITVDTPKKVYKHTSWKCQTMSE